MDRGTPDVEFPHFVDGELMKYVSKISVVLFAMIAMSACSKKGSNNNAAAAAAAAAAAYGTQCVNPGVAGCTPYYGPGGQWSGALTVINPGVYQQMVMMNGGGGVMASQYVGVSVRLSQGTGRFKLSTSQWNRWVPMMQKDGQAFSQGLNNFSIVSQNYYLNGAVPYGYQPNVVVPGMPGIAPGAQNVVTVSVQFVDAVQMVGNATITYNGVPVAQGQVSGRPNYGGAYAGGVQYQQTAGYAPAVLPYR